MEVERRKAKTSQGIHTDTGGIPALDQWVGESILLFLLSI